jgi:dTDP-4-amino-4,6-dideoxygalactose transaminase
MKNPYAYVEDFEEAIGDFTGAPYVVCVESCSAALFLAFQHVKLFDCTSGLGHICCPKFTYPSAPNAVIHAGGKIRWEDGLATWQTLGAYRMFPSRVIDSAKRIARGMWKEWTGECDPIVCLSFHAKKSLPIGRGGAILCGSQEESDWFRCMRHDGRHNGIELPEDALCGPGWNFLMSPEQAARGLTLMSHLKDVNICAPDPYQDLSQYEWYK